MGDLRDKLVADLRLRNRSDKTIAGYVGCLRRLAGFYMRSPDQLQLDELRDFLLELTALGASPAWRKGHVAAFRFFYSVTLGWSEAEVFAALPYPAVPTTLPDIPTFDELLQLFDAAQTLKHRALLEAGYSAGLRIGEAVALQPADIDSAKGVIRVRRGKGAKPRLAKLSLRFLDTAGRYWVQARPEGPWLFPGRSRDRHISSRAVQRQVQLAVARAGLERKVTFHTLRHAFATHALERGTDVRIIQALLGHATLKTTLGYLRVQTNAIQNTPSSFDR